MKKSRKYLREATEGKVKGPKTRTETSWLYRESMKDRLPKVVMYQNRRRNHICRPSLSLALTKWSRSPRTRSAFLSIRVITRASETSWCNNYHRRTRHLRWRIRPMNSCGWILKRACEVWSEKTWNLWLRYLRRTARVCSCSNKISTDMTTDLQKLKRRFLM